MIELSHLVAKTGRLTDTDIERYGPIAALSYGPAYVDEVGILCELNARYLGMTPLALAECLVGDLERRALARENGMIVPRIAA